MFCEKCGSEIPKGAKFCEKCGFQVESAKQEEKVDNPHKKWTFWGITGGMVFVSIVTVGVLFATGILRNNKESIRMSTDVMQSDTGGSENAKQPANTPTETVTEEPAITPAITPNPTTQPKSITEPKQPTDAPASEPAAIDESDISEPNAGISDVSMEYLQSVTATSELSEQNMVHSAERICDGKLENAWVEGVSGQGVGEAVTFVFDDSYSFSSMKINAGYQKTRKLYHKNSRPKKIRITFSDSSSITVKLKDHYGVQKIDFKNCVVADQVTVTIESVYKGSKYKDTVISELKWY